jgi:hypothetical protein
MTKLVINKNINKNKLNIDIFSHTQKINEKIVKKGNKWQVQSEDGTRNLGTYDTKKEAEKRLKQVHYFKSLNESKDELLDTLYSTKEPEYGSCYLLDDGSFVFPFTKDEKTSLAFHGDEEDIIYDKYGQFKGYDLNHELQHDYNIITLNSRKSECRMNFSGKPTNAQYSSLLKWLDFVIAEGNDKVDFEDSGTEQTLGKYTTITLKDKTSEEIIDSIKRYFVSGVLVESRQDIKKYFNSSLKEQLLLELNRNQLINKSKASDNYKNTSKGKNRWERRTRSRIANTVRQYNKIDMNDFFKNDILRVGIEVFGETNTYIVTVRYSGVLKEIANQIRLNNDKLEFKCILIALQKVFNSDDVYVSCSCPDRQYRQSYYATKDNYNSGPKELRPSDITNPNNTKGGGCKHVNLILSNVDWIMKVVSVINNYIHYMEENMQRQYADIIYPKLFNKQYTKDVQLDLFDTGDQLKDSEEEITLSNRYGRDRGKFKPKTELNTTLEKPLTLEKEKNLENKNTPTLKLNLDNKKE